MASGSPQPRGIGTVLCVARSLYWQDPSIGNTPLAADWAASLDIADLVNSQPEAPKDVAKGLKKRLGVREDKVQVTGHTSARVLTLTLALTWP